MTVISTNSPTAELQALDAQHHMHPLSANTSLGEKRARVITRAEGAWLTDSEGERILDAMAGLWCVNIGYGRNELADVAIARPACGPAKPDCNQGTTINTFSTMLTSSAITPIRTGVRVSCLE